MPFSYADYKNEFDTTAGTLLDKSMAVLAKYVGYMPTVDTWVGNPLSRFSLLAQRRNPTHATEVATALQDCKVRIANGDNVTPATLIETVIKTLFASGKHYRANCDLHTALCVIRELCVATSFSTEESREEYYATIYKQTEGDICTKTLAMLRDYAHNHLLHDSLIRTQLQIDTTDDSSPVPILVVSPTVRLLRSFIATYTLLAANKEKPNEERVKPSAKADAKPDVVSQKLKLTSPESFFTGLQKYIAEITKHAEDSEPGDAFSEKMGADTHLKSIVIVTRTCCAVALTEATEQLSAALQNHAKALKTTCDPVQVDALRAAVKAINTAHEQPSKRLFDTVIPAIKSAAYAIITTLGQDSPQQDVIVAAEALLHFDNPGMLQFTQLQHVEIAEVERDLSAARVLEQIQAAHAQRKTTFPKRQQADEQLLGDGPSPDELRAKKAMAFATLAWINKSAVPLPAVQPVRAPSASCSSTDEN